MERWWGSVGGEVVGWCWWRGGGVECKHEADVYVKWA